jgi:uncharacterized membrane protein
MSSTATTFLAIRAAHVLVAALWIGATVFASTLLMPAIDASGPTGGQLMQRLNRRGFHVYMAAISMTTLASGLYLFWHFTGGFDLSVSTSHAGVVFGLGGVAGLFAGIIGGGVVGRSGKQLEQLVTTTITIADDQNHRALLGRIAALKNRMRIGTRVVVGLQTVALVCMAVGHYV